MFWRVAPPKRLKFGGKIWRDSLSLFWLLFAFSRLPLALLTLPKPAKLKLLLLSAKKAFLCLTRNTSLKPTLALLSRKWKLTGVYHLSNGRIRCWYHSYCNCNFHLFRRRAAVCRMWINQESLQLSAGGISFIKKEFYLYK